MKKEKEIKKGEIIIHGKLLKSDFNNFNFMLI